jgi:FeS assembly SUF system protein
VSSEVQNNIESKPASMDVPGLRDKIMAALKTVYDPEIPVDIYELGLIYEISIYPINNVHVMMTLTSPSCPSAEAIPSEVEQKIKAIEGVNDVKVEITWDPPYSQDMMSEAAKLELGFL